MDFSIGLGWMGYHRNGDRTRSSFGVPGVSIVLELDADEVPVERSGTDGDFN